MNSGIIRNAWICDGSGADPYRADLQFENRKITKIGEQLSANLPEINAEGLTLAPGFIDIHAHSDLSLAAAPDAFGKISQGVTTEVSGNCGLSPFPVLTDEVRAHLEKTYKRYQFPVTWQDYSGYCAAIEQRKPTINFASFCGYNTLRANVTGYQNSPVSAEMRETMRDQLTEMLAQGAVGLSTGLLYVPGKFASTEELETVVSALKNTGKNMSTHLRSEGDSLLEAVQEAFRIARSGDHKLQISHLKTALPRNWDKINELLSMIRSARKNGLTVHADRYPYTYSQTSLSVILPPPWDVMTDAAIMADLNDFPEKQLFLEEKLRTAPPDWERIILCSTAYLPAAKYAGESYPEICRKLSIKPETLCVKLMVADAPGTMAAFGGLSAENLNRILLEPYVCCGSDETARPESYAFGVSHPRGFGSFPRFFQMLVPQLGIGETIRKMTSLPAEICRFSDRGLLRPGYAADMVLFSPEEFKDTATFKSPHSPSTGIHSVFVNGVLSYKDGRVIARSGRALRV